MKVKVKKHSIKSTYRPCWINKETGELLTVPEMRAQFAEFYDDDDPCNWVDFREYYEYAGVFEF